MSKVPLWYWPVALTPAISGLTAAAVVFGCGAVRIADVGARTLDVAAMVGSLYVGLVLLGYLLFALCDPSPNRADARPDQVVLNDI